MNEYIIKKVDQLDTQKLMPLVEESKSEGFRHLGRLVTDYEDGTNKFDKDGEALFVAMKDGEIVGVCGLNKDPYTNKNDVGRVRRLYVSQKRTSVRNRADADGFSYCRIQKFLSIACIKD